MLADVRVDERAAPRPGRRSSSPGRGRWSGRRCRTAWSGWWPRWPTRPRDPDAARFQALLDERGPARRPDRVTEVLWGSRFRVHHRVAETFRAGPVLLAGDAAHVHSPAGGQGMNLGICDAVALGDTLADVLDGGPDALLDEYAAARRPLRRGRGRLRRPAHPAGHRAPGRPPGCATCCSALLSALPPARHRLALRLSGLTHRPGRSPLRRPGPSTRQAATVTSAKTTAAAPTTGATPYAAPASPASAAPTGAVSSPTTRCAAPTRPSRSAGTRRLAVRGPEAVPHRAAGGEDGQRQPARHRVPDQREPGQRDGLPDQHRAQRGQRAEPGGQPARPERADQPAEHRRRREEPVPGRRHPQHLQRVEHQHRHQPADRQVRSPQ